MKNIQRRRILEMLPLVFIGAALLAFCLSCAVYGSRCEQALGRLQHGWSLSGEAVAVLPQREEKPAGEPSIMQVTLDAAFDKNQTICFFSVYEDVTVRLDGETIYRFEKPDGEQITCAAPNYWNVVSLPGGCAGSILEIELVTPYQQYSNTIPEVYYGELAEITRFVHMETVPRFVAALAIMFVGLIFCIVAVILRFYVEDSTGLYSLSLFFVVLATFLASQQTTILLDLYGNSSYILLQHIAFMLCPVMYARYLSRIHTGTVKRLAKLLYYAGIFNLGLIVLLQLLGVKDMPEMMSTTRNLCAIAIVLVFVLELRQKRRILVFLIALLLSYTLYHYFFTGTITWVIYVGIFGYIYILVHRIIFTMVRAQAKEIRLKAELEVSRSEIATIQITSHFFYHTLDSIRALIRLDVDKAYKMTGDFAKYLRHRVDGVERMEETIPFSRELRSIRAYTDIKRAQLGERFSMCFDVDNDDFEILPLTVQPLVENAVIHAVQRRREGGEVRLVCRETDHGYHIEVIDNGPGPNAEPEVINAQRQSTALRNVNTRLEFYGIAPLAFANNELGGMTVSLDTPKKILRKGKTE